MTNQQKAYISLDVEQGIRTSWQVLSIEQEMLILSEKMVHSRNFRCLSFWFTFIFVLCLIFTSGSQLYSNISSEFVILYTFLNTMLIYLTKTHICLNFNKVTWKSKSLVLMSYTRQVLCSSTTANLVREELMSKHLTDVLCFSNIIGKALSTNIFMIWK
jgi:hypothetical protein